MRTVPRACQGFLALSLSLGLSFSLALAAAVPARAATYRTLYAFRADAADGQYPAAPLLAVGTTLYGTTLAGGAFANGTMFGLDLTGAERVLHAFGSGLDGIAPAAGLIAWNGALYGTTQASIYVPGCTNCGGATLFAITGAGRYRIFFRFAISNDQQPGPSLLVAGGWLYGVSAADSGGYPGNVFRISQTGTETDLHDFRGAPRDGANPSGGLASLGPASRATAFLGTTAAGGTANAGTIFGLSATGSEHALYDFGATPTDAAAPSGSLLVVGGLAYGAAQYGGTGTKCDAGCGALFALSQAGTETVLHDFQGPDGANPVAGLTALGGLFYGTTPTGGAYGQGTLFSITRSGRFTVLHDFGAGSDGAKPLASLIQQGGTLYGTTLNGGTHQRGSVFAYSP